MEFVKDQEVLGLLRDNGITQKPAENDLVYLHLSADEAVRLCLQTPQAADCVEEGGRVIELPKEQLASAIEEIVHRLHLKQVLLVPVARWAKIFDAVAFSLADNEDWQEFDATATVERNTRDPLLCEPRDFHTLNALVQAILSDAEGPDQCLLLTTTAAPLLVEIRPEGTIKVSCGTQVMADEVAEAFES